MPYCYWLGSLDFNILVSQYVSFQPAKRNELSAGGSATKSVSKRLRLPPPGRCGAAFEACGADARLRHASAAAGRENGNGFVHSFPTQAALAGRLFLLFAWEHVTVS